MNKAEAFFGSLRQPGYFINLFLPNSTNAEALSQKKGLNSDEWIKNPLRVFHRARWLGDPYDHYYDPHIWNDCKCLFSLKLGLPTRHSGAYPKCKSRLHRDLWAFCAKFALTKTIDSSRWATAKQDPIRSLSSASWDPLEGHKLNTQQRRSNVNWCQLALWTKLDWGRWSELPQDSVAYSTEVHHPVLFHFAYDLRKHLHEPLMSPSMA